MATVTSQPEIGIRLREWRERQRLTQLALALKAGTSARHLSFVETGRSKPGREMLLRILKHLEMPLREQNEVLLGAGYAPAFPERSLDDSELAPVRAALDRILTAHEPNPAVVFDRAWNLVAANAVLFSLTEVVDIDPVLLEPPVNVLRVGLHPRGLAPLIVNLGEWRAQFLGRLERQVAVTGDPELAALLEEVTGYPGSASDRHAAAPGRESTTAEPLKVRAPGGGVLSFVGMFASFDTPFEVTTSELAIELLFPADEATAEALRRLYRRGKPPERM